MTTLAFDELRLLLKMFQRLCHVQSDLDILLFKKLTAIGNLI